MTARTSLLQNLRIPCLVVITALGALAAVPSPGSDLAEIHQRGELVMLCFPRQPSGFVRVNLEAGPMRKVGTSAHFEGLDVELMAAFASSLGVQLTIRPIEKPNFGELIPALLAGQGDLVASSFSITAQRRQQVDFSVPYFTADRVFVAPEGSLIQSLADLRGKVVAVADGTSLEENLRQLGVAEEKIHPVEFTQEAFILVADGEADLALVEAAAAWTLLPVNPGLEIVYELPEKEEYGIAVPHGSDLLEPLNRFLEQMRASGELQRLGERFQLSSLN
jgi:ABC-type amino acid transport substrate-binding protein